MEGGTVYEDCHMKNGFLNNESVNCTWVPNSSPSFHGSVSSMVNFEDIRGENNTDQRQFFTQMDTKMENCNDEFEGYLHHPEKKRRLNPDQVRFLEKSFDVDNKLEPDRKIQLAKELGLQPRQVAIWFQNRRARCKTKVLEKEYDVLKASYDRLKADYDTLYKENEEIKNEVNLLTDKLLPKKNEKPRDHISPLDAKQKNPNFSPENVVPDPASSAKSDVFDSDSPHYNTDGIHSSALLEPNTADSSHVFESDFSQDEDHDSLSRSLLPPLGFPKLEAECFDDLQPNSCNLGFLVQDQGTWFWKY